MRRWKGMARHEDLDTRALVVACGALREIMVAVCVRAHATACSPLLLVLVVCCTCSSRSGWTGIHGCSRGACTSGQTLPLQRRWPHPCTTRAPCALGCGCTRQRGALPLPLCLRGGAGGRRVHADSSPSDGDSRHEQEGPHSPIDRRGRRGGGHWDGSSDSEDGSEGDDEIAGGRDVRDKRHKLQMQIRQMEQEAGGLSPQAPSLEEFKETLEKVGETLFVNRPQLRQQRSHVGASVRAHACVCVPRCAQFRRQNVNGAHVRAARPR